jgi:hypothetical protein
MKDGHKSWVARSYCNLVEVAQHIYNTYGEAVHGSFSYNLPWSIWLFFLKLNFFQNIHYQRKLLVMNEFRPVRMKQATHHVMALHFIIYWCIHPKHEKLHPSKNFHFVNICHLHIGQRVNQNFILKSKSYTDAYCFPMGRAKKQRWEILSIDHKLNYINYHMNYFNKLQPL